MPFRQFTHVVFALNDAPLATPYACETSFFVDVADMLDANIRPYFLPVCDYIDAAKRDKGKSARVLIHCQHGQSRSGALTVAYVMKSRKVSLKEAFEIVATGRPCLQVNVSFIGQLQQFEKDLFGNRSPTLSHREAEDRGWCKAFFALKERDAKLELVGDTRWPG